MQAVLNEPDPASESWTEISPMLDAALGHLGQKDHDAIVLRFFSDKSMSEVGTAMGTSEDAAKMRVNRALEKLRKFFDKRGVALTTAIIAGSMSAHSVQAAPDALTKSVIAVAAAKGAAAGGSTAGLVKGALKLMAWTKAKFVITATAVVLLAAGTTGIAFKEVDLDSLRMSDRWWNDIDQLDLKKVPAAVVLRRTHFPDYRPTVDGPSIVTGKTEMESGQIVRMIGKNRSFDELIYTAYNPEHGYIRIVFPAGAPKDHYDFLATVRDRPAEKLQEKIRDQLGFSAHIESRETNVFLLKLVDPALLKSKAVPGSSLKWFNETQTLAGPASNWENMFNTPILDLTGSTDRYDPGTIKGVYTTNLTLFNEALRTNLGLELAPSRAPIDMLIVEKIK